MGFDFNKYKNEGLGCGTILVLFIFAFALAFGITCLYAWASMLLWNWVMPMLWEGAPVMTFWPMWCLYELCSILFKAKININTNQD